MPRQAPVTTVPVTGQRPSRSYGGSLNNRMRLSTKSCMPSRTAVGPTSRRRISAEGSYPVGWGSMTSESSPSYEKYMILTFSMSPTRPTPLDTPWLPKWRT